MFKKISKYKYDVRKIVKTKWIGVTFSIVGLLLVSGMVYAFIQENGKVKGTTFKVSSTPEQIEGGVTDSNENLKLLIDLVGLTDESNLTDEVNGPTFEDISTVWKDKVLLKLYNQGDKPLNLASTADYIDDANTLRDDIFIRVSAWNDTNANGSLEFGEIGEEYGYDTILRMKNDTFNLGSLNPGAVKGLVMEFDGTGLSNANAEQMAVYDFMITGEEIE